MNETVKPLKKVPDKFRLPGDYNKTVTAIFAGIIAENECVISNYNRSKDILELIELFSEYGFQISRNTTEIRIYPSPEAGFPECAEVSFDGGVMPLSLLLGYLIGKKNDCSVHYGENINQDLLDRIVGFFSKRGIDLFHEADERTIIYRAGALSPLDWRLGSTLPYLKNMILMTGLVSDISLVLKEDVITSGDLEWSLETFGAPIGSRDIKSRWVTDPDDPRKRKLEAEAEWKRELHLARTHNIPGGEIEIPSDLISTLAIIELAVLKKKKTTLINVLFSDRLNRIMKLLEAAGVVFQKSNSRNSSIGKIGDLTVDRGKRLKARKISGETAQGIIEEVPFIAPILALAEGKSIIRNIPEYCEWANSPFVEISTGLQELGAKAGAIEDGLIIEGAKELDSDKYGPFQNRENALAFYMTALAGKAKAEFESFELVRTHYGDLIDEIRESSDNQIISYIRS